MITDDDDLQPPEMPLGYDDLGRPVPTVEPIYECAQPDEGDQRGDFEEKLARFLSWLAEGGNVQTAGRKVLVLAHLAGKSGCRSDAELAAKLNMSRARISQLRADLARTLPSLGRCRRRQKFNLTP